MKEHTRLKITRVCVGVFLLLALSPSIAQIAGAPGVFAEVQVVRSDWVCGDFNFDRSVSVIDTLLSLRASVGLDNLVCGWCPKTCMSCDSSSVVCGCEGETTCGEADIECVVTCNSTTCGFACD